MSENPFAPNSDRWQIWEMLVARDIKAFVNADWNMVADDFVEEGFMGIDGGRQGHPDSWRLNFPNLNTYRDEWLRQAKSFQEIEWGEDIEEALFRVTVLRDIEIRQQTALVHKKFFGSLVRADGTLVPTDWQTLYRCRKMPDGWKIAGFTGYLPHFLASPISGPSKRLPQGASQHKTAGPYSPVLEVSGSNLVVISGQAAIDDSGTVIGDTIEEQARYTLENCRKQLAQAKCSLDDVFKVNVYLTDLENWPRFNEVYREYFSEPLPVRTAVGSDLLMTLLVEIEMWAAKS